MNVRVMGLGTLLLMVVALGGCGKAQEKVSEVAAEKAIEAAIEKGGGQAQVDLREGGVKTTGVDEKGQKFSMEAGGVQISEAELGLPLYPGAQEDRSKSQRVVNGGLSLVTLAFDTPDEPAKVMAFYREQLRARSAGNTMMDMAEGDGSGTLMLNQEGKAEDASWQVHVKKRDGEEPGTHVDLMASRQVKAAP